MNRSSSCSKGFQNERVQRWSRKFSLCCPFLIVLALLALLPVCSHAMATNAAQSDGTTDYTAIELDIQATPIHRCQQELLAADKHSGAHDMQLTRKEYLKFLEQLVHYHEAIPLAQFEDLSTEVQDNFIIVANQHGGIIPLSNNHSIVSLEDFCICTIHTVVHSLEVEAAGGTAITEEPVHCASAMINGGNVTELFQLRENHHYFHSFAVTAEERDVNEMIQEFERMLLSGNHDLSRLNNSEIFNENDEVDFCAFYDGIMENVPREARKLGQNNCTCTPGGTGMEHHGELSCNFQSFNDLRLEYEDETGFLTFVSSVCGTYDHEDYGEICFDVRTSLRTGQEVDSTNHLTNVHANPVVSCEVRSGTDKCSRCLICNDGLGLALDCRNTALNFTTHGCIEMPTPGAEIRVSIPISFNIDRWIGDDPNATALILEAIEQYARQAVEEHYPGGIAAATQEGTGRRLDNERRRLEVSFQEDSVEVLQVMPCLPDYDCTTVFSNYEVIVTDDDPIEVEAALTEATQTGAVDGTLAEIVAQMNPANPMVISEPTQTLAPEPVSYSHTNETEFFSGVTSVQDANHTIIIPPTFDDQTSPPTEKAGRGTLFWVWIGVGIFAGVAVCALAIMVFLYRRRKQQKDSDDEINDDKFSETSGDNAGDDDDDDDDSDSESSDSDDDDDEEGGDVV